MTLNRTLDKLVPNLLYVFREQNQEMLRKAPRHKKPIFYKNHTDIQPEAYDVKDLNRTFENLFGPDYEMWELIDMMVVLQRGYHGDLYSDLMEDYPAKAEFYRHYAALMEGLSEESLYNIEHHMPRMEDDLKRHHNKAIKFVHQFRDDRAEYLKNKRLLEQGIEPS